MNQALISLYTQPPSELSFARLYEVFFRESHALGAAERFSVFRRQMRQVERRFLWTRLAVQDNVDLVLQDYRHRRLCLQDLLMRPLSLKLVEVEPWEVVWKAVLSQWQLLHHWCDVRGIPAEVEKSMVEYFCL